MKTEHWRHIETIFHRAVDLPPSDRAAFVDRECKDPELRAKLKRMLECDGEDDELMDQAALLRVEGDGRTGSNGPLTDPLVGQQIGPYHIVERLATGGMGVVYRAEFRRPDLTLTVALKLIRHGMGSQRVIERFHNERRALANLNHPNIARLLDGGQTADDLPFLVMEYIDGQPIDAYCDQRRLSIAERIKLFRSVCHAVHFAHQNLVVHRDLKPSNILVTEDGVPKLLDFGIAKMLSPDELDTPTERTETIARVLTPDYAAPEQLLGDPVTTAADIYALGVNLYRLLTGCAPYRLTSQRVSDMEQIICEREPVRPSTAVMRCEDERAGGGETTTIHEYSIARATTPERLRRRLRGDLDNIVMKALRKEPLRRYPSALTFADDLERYLTGRPVTARKETVFYVGWKFFKRHRLSVTSAAAAFLILAVAMIVIARIAHIAAVERDLARSAQHRADAEAAHARIEADSATELASLLSNVFVIAASGTDDAQRNDALWQLGAEQRRIERQYDDRRHILANLYDALGHVHLGLDRVDEARELMEHAASIRREEFGERSLEMARSFNSLGELLYALGDYDGAADYFRQALDLHRSLPHGVHTDVALAANNLAVALRQLGRLDEAEALHREALALRREHSHDHDPDIAESLNNLAGVMVDRARYDEAERLLEEALEIRRHVQGSEHPLVAQTINNLAVVTHSAGHAERAAELYAEAIGLYRLMPEPDGLALGRTLTNYANALRSQNRLPEAEEALREAVDRLEAELGPDHPTLATAYASLAKLNKAQGDPHAAEEPIVEALRIRRQAFPDSHPIIATTLTTYGSCLVDDGRPAEAEPLLQEAVDIYQQALPGDHWFIARAQVSLGRCLLELERYEEAEPLLLEGHDSLRASRGASAEETIHAVELLCRLYEVWGKPEHAARYRRLLDGES
jgi:serine/threonine protein kinase/tetratricopeptide (TPR) repeat protein